MPTLAVDESIPAVTWRGGINDGEFNIKRMQDESFKIINQSRTGKLLHTPNTVLGKRNGVPMGRDQDYHYAQLVEMNPYPMAKTPFLSDSVEDMYPKTYGEANIMGGTNGTIRNVASITGAPLAMALDDGTEILQRIHSEKFRIDPQNPLSGEFALSAFVKNQTNPQTGPMSDYMRIGLAHDAEDAYILNQKLAAGFYREDLNNIPAKIREKLTERNNLNKTEQDIKSAKDRLLSTDPTGILTQTDEKNMIDQQKEQEKAQMVNAPTGGNDLVDANDKRYLNKGNEGPDLFGNPIPNPTPGPNPKDMLADHELEKKKNWGVLMSDLLGHFLPPPPNPYTNPDGSTQSLVNPTQGGLENPGGDRNLLSEQVGSKPMIFV